MPDRPDYSIDDLIITDDDAETVKEMREQGFSDDEIRDVLIEDEMRRRRYGRYISRHYAYIVGLR